MDVVFTVEEVVLEVVEVDVVVEEVVRGVVEVGIDVVVDVVVLVRDVVVGRDVVLEDVVMLAVVVVWAVDVVVVETMVVEEVGIELEELIVVVLLEAVIEFEIASCGENSTAASRPPPDLCPLIAGGLTGSSESSGVEFGVAATSRNTDQLEAIASSR